MIREEASTALPRTNGTLVPPRRTARRNGRSTADNQQISEYYNALLRNLRLQSSDVRTPRAIGLTSVPGCGKSSVVATNLAICMATSDDRNVLLVNADPRNRVPEVTFSLERSVGFYDVLRGRATVAEAVQPTEIPNLTVISAGTRHKESDSLSCLMRFGSVLDDLKREQSLIVFNLPMASELTPCFDMAAQLDGVVLEVESDRVKRDAARGTWEHLQFMDANVLGCVFKQC